MNVTSGVNSGGHIGGYMTYIGSWGDNVSWDDDPLEGAYNNSDYITTTIEVWDPVHDFIWDFNRNSEIQFIFADMEN